MSRDMNRKRLSPRTLSRLLAPLLLLPALLLNVDARVMLVDFGTDASFRGASVASPDENGNHWNGFAPGGFLADLVDVSGDSTGHSLGFTTPVASDSYNGPAGETSDPPTTEEIGATTFDAVALGALGATNAVFDYVAAEVGTSVRFTLTNLDPNRTYTLTFFGSRKYPTGEEDGNDETRATAYVATDSAGTPLVSAALRVGVFGDHNPDTVAVLEELEPDASNRIFIEIRGLTPTNAGFLNAMSIEAIAPPTPPVGDEILLIDFGSDDSFRGASVSNPDANGSYWNSVWSGAFFGGLVDLLNDPTPLGLGFDAAPGTDSFNGPDGVIDADALGLLGGATNAVNDYYVSSRFQIQGLDPANTYTLTFFGSHKFSDDDATLYRVHSDSGYSTEVASVSLNVQTPGSPWLHNSNTVAFLAYLAPQEGNALYVEFIGANGNDGYLNALRIDVHYPEVPPGVVDFSALEEEGGVLSASFVGADGVRYTLQYTTNLLDDESWQDVTVGGVPVTGEGDGVTLLKLEDEEADDPWRIYRLIESP